MTKTLTPVTVADTPRFETILMERRERVGLITLNRPKQLNALNAQVAREVLAALREFDADRNIGAIVITGGARAFAAGADIAEMADKSFADLQAQDLFADWDAVRGIGKPVIAAVAGYALGGGCELAMLCDFIIASEDAQFGQPEIKLGILPGIGGSQRLSRAVGKALAMDLVSWLEMSLSRLTW
jgi:enoyl-CoA hydratase